MTRFKSDVATEADWSFMDDELTAAAVRRAAEKGRILLGMSEDDAFQECALWLSVRPEMVARYRERYTDPSGLRGFLAQQMYRNALRGPEIAADKHRAVSLDEMYHTEIGE